MENKNWRDVAKEFSDQKLLDMEYQTLDLWEQTLTGHPNEYDIDLDFNTFEGLTDNQIKERIDTKLDNYLNSFENVLDLVNYQNIGTSVLELLEYMSNSDFDPTQFLNEVLGTFLQGVVEKLHSELAKYDNEVEKLIQNKRKELVEEIFSEYKEWKNA